MVRRLILFVFYTMNVMVNEKINLNNCTKEQIINVVKAAKERKFAWEKRVQSEMRMRQAVSIRA